MRKGRSYGILFLLLLLHMGLWGQEDLYDSLLTRIDTVENPVYKPVISFSYGVLDFLGEVQNQGLSPVIGRQSARVNLATFVDRKNNFVANFYFLLGKMGGNSYSHSDLSRNLNFQTSISMIGANLEYRFGHWIPPTAYIRPYVSLGIANLDFSAKGDLKDAEGTPYYFWSDGSIRDADEAGGSGNKVFRDYRYETDLRQLENQEYALGDYKQRTLAVPLEAGLHFYLSRRAFFSLGLSYNYSFSDFIDNVSAAGTSLQGEKGNDAFLFTHLSVHFDLFSDPETRRVDLLFADADFDDAFFGDEDGDFILDVTDRCPATPYGVEVDSLGCPLDGDADGVPDYLDQELFTAPGAWVNEDGESVLEEDVLATLRAREQAMARSDVEAYLEIISGQYRLASLAEIPEKFQVLDLDSDGYLSFDELLNAVDQYFDSDQELSLEQLRQVNEFFFSQ